MWPVARGTVITTKRMRAATLMATSTALAVALSLVPTTSNAVTSSVMITAGRLTKPPASPPLMKPSEICGPTVSAWGMCHPTLSKKPTMWPDQPTATALAPSAYSRISAQPTSQAISSPITAYE